MQRSTNFPSQPCEPSGEMGASIIPYNWSVALFFPCCCLGQRAANVRLLFGNDDYCCCWHSHGLTLIVYFHIYVECALADYVSGMQSEKVPFVFLPVQGQLINPNAEIALSGNHSAAGIGHVQRSSNFSDFISNIIFYFRCTGRRSSCCFPCLCRIQSPFFNTIRMDVDR